MHVPGLLGMPRRIYTYEAGRGWEGWNIVVGIGAIFQAAGILCFAYNMIESALSWQRGWSRPVGCVDPRMVDDLSAARL